MAPGRDCPLCPILLFDDKAKPCNHHFDERGRLIPFPPYDICDKIAIKIGKALKFAGRTIKWLFQF